MRLLLWTTLICLCAIHDTTLALVAGMLLVGCAENHSFAVRRRWRVPDVVHSATRNNGLSGRLW
jgi:hypothetical protein